MDNNIVEIMKALGDSARLELVKHIAKKKETGCAELLKVFKMPQPTLSRHLNIMVDAGVLSFRKEGVINFYKIEDKSLKENGLNISQIIK